MKLQRFSGNPILSPNPANPWENLVTCNPGVILDDGMFYMLYRAAGDDEKHVIRFGLATSTDGFHFKRESDLPVFGPSADGPDSGCVEDPRIVKFGDTFYITRGRSPDCQVRRHLLYHVRVQADGARPLLDLPARRNP